MRLSVKGRRGDEKEVCVRLNVRGKGVLSVSEKRYRRGLRARV